MEERADDGGTYLWQFRDEFLVRCPRCERMARVGQPAESGTRLTCAHCGLSRGQAPGASGWSGPVCAYLHGRCGTCGRPAARQPRRLRHPPARETAVSRCAGCGAQTRLPVRWWPLGTPEGLDPVFGLPLWLRTACRGHLLWAYNARHLGHESGTSAVAARSAIEEEYQIIDPRRRGSCARTSPRSSTTTT
jgi:hypothetical protein